MAGSVIVAGARTPVGKLSGALSSFSAAELGGFAIKGALERAGLSPEQVEYVFMGHVLQAGAGQITARQAAVNAGISMSVPATTVNKVCPSGMHAIYLADLMIQAGDADVVVAGGMESMTNAPYLLPGARGGYRLGDQKVVDSTLHDGLFCTIEQRGMGDATEDYNRALGISRQEQDAYAARSHERAAAAMSNGVFDDEITPVEIPQRRGQPVRISDDEGVRADTTAEVLAKLRPAFAPDGTITAGSSSQISDGACAVVVTSDTRAAELGLPVLAEIVSYGSVAGPDPSLQSQPSNAIRRALSKAGISTDEIDLFEINEAFAAVAIQSVRDLGVSDDIVNVNGGAISMGHPIGMSGARITLHLALELGRRGGGLGAAGLCGGGGQGEALLLHVRP